jgi:hypothetical protein
MGARGRPFPTTHGFCRDGKVTPEYSVLAGIKRRCLNPNEKNFHRYGGRGISICDRWVNGEGNLSGIECFLDDLGPRPSLLHSVERIDNDGWYEPGNCRWATAKDQANNTRRNITLVFEGAIYTFAAACDRFGLSYNHLYKRVTRKGWTLAQVIQEKDNA